MRLGMMLLLLSASCSPQAGSEPAAGAKPGAPAQALAAEVELEPEPTSAVELLPPGQQPVRVRVEVVSAPQDRQRGLMYRKHMDPDAGMLFLFDRAEQLSFWMRNTYIPLDMIFIQSDMRILGIVENAEPETDDPRRVQGDSQYVLEVNAGFARQHGLQAGTAVRFIDVPGMPNE